MFRTSSPRYLVAHLPTFRLERCGWSADQPVALVTDEKSALRVQCATPVAARRGIHRGMTAAEARAVLPALQVEELDADAEAADLHDLARQLLRVSPSVCTLPPDSLVAEISRTAGRGPGGRATAGAERALQERVRLRLEQLGHPAHVVIADDPRTAWACAAWGRKSRIVPPGQSARALAELPLDALELPHREAELLHGLGVRTVGAFAALPPASVVGRLSAVTVAAHALARGQGQRPTIAAWREDEPLVLSQALMHPVVDQDALVFVLNALLRDGAARLASVDRAVSRVVLRMTVEPQEDEPLDDRTVEPLDGGTPGDTPRGTGLRGRAPAPPPALALGGVQELTVRLGAPTRDPRHMLALLRARLDGVRLAGPVQAVALELPEPREFTGRQRDLLDHQRAAEALADVVARLQDELGGDAVLAPRLVPRHRPEAAWQAAPFQAPAARLAVSRPALPHVDLLGQQRPDGSDPVREWEGFALPSPPLRPTLLHHPPVAVEVRTRPVGPGLPDAPQQLHLDGRWHPLDEVQGPEAIGCEWWRDEVDRACWRVRLPDGRRLWIYEEDQHWAMHGSFD